MFSLRHFRRRAVNVTMTLLLATALTSCELAKNQLTYDRSGDLEQEDFRKGLAPRPIPTDDAAGIPDLQPVVATPEDLRLPTPLVTVSVNQTVSLRDLMFELAEQADVDLELDPQIRGTIIFTARERPFDEVIDRIARMAGLRYTFKDNVLRVELDRPYVKTYKVDYINIIRSVQSSISTSASVVSGSEANVGSAAQIATQVESNFWQDIQENLEQILTSSDTHVALSTLADPEARPVMPSAPPPIPVDPNNPDAGYIQPPAPQVPPTLTVNTPAADPLIPSPPSTFSISRQSGLITVFSSERQHKQIETYLAELKRNITSQVLIEAKVLEVSLSDEYAAGIDWGQFNVTGLATAQIEFGRPAFLDPVSNTDGFVATLKPGSDLNVAVDAVSRFGTVRALSNPRLTVINNQPAILNVVQNRVFFEIEADAAQGENGPAIPTFSSDARSVPEGLLINVTPSINVDTGEIAMVLRPTLTKVVGEVSDPVIPLTLAANNIPPIQGIDNLVPELSVQELDSVVRAQSGQVIVMGGLMSDNNTSTDTGIPVLSSLPLIGNAFKSHSDRVQKTELVIFLKATIVPGSNIHPTDKELYEKFGNDRRPWKM